MRRGSRRWGRILHSLRYKTDLIFFRFVFYHSRRMRAEERRNWHDTVLFQTLQESAAGDDHQLFIYDVFHRRTLFNRGIFSELGRCKVGNVHGRVFWHRCGTGGYRYHILEAGGMDGKQQV